MELANAASDYLHKTSPEVRATDEALRSFDIEIAEVLVKLLAPITPHWAEELWQTELGHSDSVHHQAWPDFDPEAAKADELSWRFR